MAWRFYKICSSLRRRPACCGSRSRSVERSLTCESFLPSLTRRRAQEKGVGDLDESVTNAFPADIDAADFALSSKHWTKWLKGHETYAATSIGKLHVLGLMLKTLFTDGEEKIIVVSNFTTTLDLIEKHCKRHKYPYCRLDGWVEHSIGASS